MVRKCSHDVCVDHVAAAKHDCACRTCSQSLQFLCAIFTCSSMHLARATGFSQSSIAESDHQAISSLQVWNHTCTQPFPDVQLRLIAPAGLSVRTAALQALGCLSVACPSAMLGRDARTVMAKALNSTAASGLKIRALSNLHEMMQARRVACFAPELVQGLFCWAGPKNMPADELEAATRLEASSFEWFLFVGCLLMSCARAAVALYQPPRSAHGYLQTMHGRCLMSFQHA